jgi:hypothetical protein
MARYGLRHTVVYCWASSQSLCPHLKNQRRELEEFGLARRFAHGEFVEEISEGMNFSRWNSPN